MSGIERCSMAQLCAQKLYLSSYTSPAKRRVKGRSMPIASPFPLPGEAGESGVFVVPGRLAHLGVDHVHHGRVEQRGDVAQLAVLGDVSEQAAHDLSAPRLWELGGEQDLPRLRDRTDHRRHVGTQVVHQGLAGLALD